MSEKVIEALENNIKNRHGVFETTKSDLINAFSQLINYLKNENATLKKKLATQEEKANKTEEVKPKKGNK